MKPTPSLWQIILLIAMLVGLVWQVSLLNPIWHEGVRERVRHRQARNPVRNRERWQRRRARWLRQEPLKGKQKRRSSKTKVVLIPSLSVFVPAPGLCLHNGVDPNGRRERLNFLIPWQICEPIGVGLTRSKNNGCGKS